MTRTAVIFRYELLPPSETFIDSQAAALKKFQPCYAGVQRAANSLPIPNEPIVLMRNGSIAERVRRRLFLHTGWAPNFYRQLRRRQPALIHAHFGPDGAIALPLISELRVPLIVTLHGYDVTSSEESLSESFTGRLYLQRKQRLFKAASLFTCDSEFIRQRAIASGFPESKLRVHYIGVDRSLFVPRNEVGQRNVILFVGRLVEKKGCRFLIEAMDLVRRDGVEAKLVIIGDGPLRPSLEALAREKALSCQFLGLQPSQVVRDWLACSGVFCAPSVTAANGDSEGLGIVFTEAQAMGLPVVSFNSGGIPEVVRHGETGLLAPEGDREILAEYLLRYLTDETFWRASRRNAIAWIKRRFDLHRQTGELEDMYQEVTRMPERGGSTVIINSDVLPGNKSSA